MCVYVCVETQITKYRQSVACSCSHIAIKVICAVLSCTWGVWSTNCSQVVTRPGHCYLLFSTTGALLSGPFTCRTAHCHNTFILCARKPCLFHFKLQLKKQEQRRQLRTFIKFMYKASHLPLIIYLFQYFTIKMKKNLFTLDFICLFHHTFPLMCHSYIK